MGLRTVISNRRLLRQSWCQGPGLVRAGPSGEERCTPHYTVPVSPQCPQEISLLTLPVFQGAAVSSERFSQSLPPRNVAELGGSPPLSGVSRAARSAVPCRSSVPGHRASRSKYTRGQSRETGSLSKSSGGVGALAKRVLLGPAFADSGSLVFLRDDAGLRTVVSNRRLLRQSWCYIPGLMRAGPSGEERCTPHYTVPVSPQCPQEISLLTLPVFQGAAVSSERFFSVSSAQKCSGAGRLATPSGVSRAARSAVPCRSSVPMHRASCSKYTRGQSQETGSLSKSSGGVGALAKRVLLGPAWADSGSLVFLEMTRVWGPSFPIGDF